MKIREGKQNEYKKWQTMNTEGDARVILTYAERWADLMEDNLTDAGELNSNTVISLAEKANEEDVDNYMYGCAVDYLGAVWVYGEALRKWYNDQNNRNKSDDGCFWL